MPILNADQFRYILDTNLNQIIDSQGGATKISNDLEGWITSKKQNYSGSGYMEQLEKNAIYFAEATGMTEGAILRLLCEGEPKPKTEEEIQVYIQYIGGTVPREQLHSPIWAYIRGYEQQKPRQVSRVDWYKVRQIRASGNTKEYLKELELLCRIYRIATGFADILLAGMFHMPQLIGSANDPQSWELNDVLDQRLMFWAGLCAGTVQLSVDGKPASEWLKNQMQQKNRSASQPNSPFQGTKADQLQKPKKWKFWR